MPKRARPIATAQEIKSLALVSSGAYSLSNFRGPLIKELISRGVKIYAFAPDYDVETYRSVRELGAIPVDFALDRAGIKPWKDFFSFFSLAKKLRQAQPDATLCYFIKPVIYGSLAAWLVGVPRRFSLVAGLGSAFNDDVEQRSFKQAATRFTAARLYKRAFSACERVFFQNTEDLLHLVDLNLLPRNKAVHVNGTGVDLDRWRQTPIPNETITFLLTARLLREKGICDYADAARLVKRKHPKVRFYLLGGLDENPSALKHHEVEAWVSEGILEWPGHINDVRPWIEKSSVFVLPSFYREGIPRSIQEALAVGRPIITTDNVGCRETVEDGVNGFLVPTRSPRDLAEAMLKFVENPELIENMARESRRLAEERFDVRKINAKMMSVMGMDDQENTGLVSGSNVTAGTPI